MNEFTPQSAHPFTNRTSSFSRDALQSPPASQSAAPEPAVSHPPVPESHAERRSEALRIAGELYRQNPDWVTFFREILGIDGVSRRFFTTPEQIAEWEHSNEYHEIQQMVAKLREKSTSQADEKEPTRVITVRLPKSLHESLRVEAHSRHTSINKLCISKLLQMIDDVMVPTD